MFKLNNVFRVNILKRLLDVDLFKDVLDLKVKPVSFLIKILKSLDILLQVIVLAKFGRHSEDDVLLSIAFDHLLAGEVSICVVDSRSDD